jgi:uncharacterized protein YbjT (DUF2867 family)
VFKHTIFIPINFIRIFAAGNTSIMSKTAIITGASGLIGSKLLNILLHSKEYEKVISLGRKKIKVKHRKLQQEIIDFDDPDTYEQFIYGDAFFCCLGTTAKKTPDKAIYYKIDHDYPVSLARSACAKRVPQFHFISAIGADASSSNFYLKTKGETERDLKNAGVDGLFIYQPSLLTGRKKNQRLGERIAVVVMKIINPLLLGGLKKYRSIAGLTVARAMFKQSLKEKKGVSVYTTDQIKERA